MSSTPGGKMSFRKMFFLMNQLAFFMLLGIMPLSAKVFSQNETISLQMKNASLTEVMNEITKMTGFDFLYNHDVLETKERVNVEVEQVKMGDLLADLLKRQGLEFEIRDEVIVVRPAKSESLPQVKEIKVSGVVKDKDALPLPGVAVVLKGTTVGVATDVDGKFSFTVPVTDKPVLVFSYLGMETKEIPVVRDKPLNVVLEENATAIEEVVITGYFNKTKESFTGSQVTVKGEELKKVASLNVIQALSAFDPSIHLEENLDFGSDPNRVPEITVRGENGFDLRGNAEGDRTNPNSPLYILDGVEVSAQKIYDLDMNRVENMTILKDATATALYGSRGANGVIVINTFRPKPGEISVTFNANFNISAPDLRDYNLMNSEEKLEYEKRAGVWTDKLGSYEEQMKMDLAYNKKLEEVKRGVNTYWLSQPLQTAVNQRYSAYIEGGDRSFRYGIDLRYDKDKGVMIGSGRDKIGIGVIFNYTIGNNFFIRNDVLVDDVVGKDSPYGEFSNFAKQNPHDRIWDEKGNMTQQLSSNQFNPLINAILPNKAETKYTSIQDNFNIDWRIIPSLRLQGRFSYTKQVNKSEKYRSPFSTEFSTETEKEKKGSYETLNSTEHKMDGNFTLSYFKTIDEHVINLGVGTNFTENRLKGEGFTATGFLNDEMSFIEYAAQYKDKGKPKGEFDKARMIGFLGNVNYGYRNCYFVDFSFRTDGSSKFGKESRFAPFWSAGLAWNAHNEGFWNAEGHTLKLRASVGSTGSVNFSSSQALTTYQYRFDTEYNGGYGAVLKGYGNSSLKWQNTLAYNTGVDLTMWGNRVIFNGDFYVKITDNLLLPIDITPSTGFLSYTENMGQVKNTGVEGRLRVVLYENKLRDMDWNLTFNIAHNKNRVQKLSNSLEAINAEANKDENVKGPKPLRTYETGRSQSALMVVRSAGIDPATGNEVFVKLNGDLTFDYDHKDKIIFGDTRPTVEGNINTNFNWKGVNFYMLFNYRYGGKLYNTTLATKVEGSNPIYNADKRVLANRWKEPGDEAMFRRIDDTSIPYQTTRLVQKDNLFSLQTLTLSYELPVKYAKAVYAERIKVQASTTDVFRLSTIKQERGTVYPFAQTYTLGLNVRF